MSDYVTLLGSEEVGNAGRNIVAAAHEISRSAGNFSDGARVMIAELRYLTELMPTFPDLVLASFLHAEVSAGGGETIADALAELGLPADTKWDADVHWPQLCARRASKKAAVALAELGR